MTDQFISESETKIIKTQIERRAKYRKEFLRMRTDPCKHSTTNAGFVFDPALQKYLSMKNCQFDYFEANPRTIKAGILMILPMFIYGYCVYTQRAKFEEDCRSGALKPCDRMFKLH